MQGITYGNQSYISRNPGYQMANRSKKSSVTGNVGAKVTRKGNQIIIDLPKQDWAVCAKVDQIPSKYELKEGGELGMHERASGAEYKVIHAAESTEENPVVVVRGEDENGKYFEEKIVVKEIDPYNVTKLELEVLNYFRPGEYQMMATLSGTDELGIRDRFNSIAAYQRDISMHRKAHFTDVAQRFQKEMDFILDYTNSSTRAEKGGNDHRAEADFLRNIVEENKKNLELYSKAARERLIDNMARKYSEELSDMLWEKRTGKNISGCTVE